MTWTRLTRRLGSDHNPLRRRADLVDAWLSPAALVMFLVLGPLLGLGAVAWMHGDNDGLQQAARTWHPVTAVLLRAAPGPLQADNGANDWLTWEPAQWQAGGSVRSGAVPVAAGTPAGASVPVWLDRAGHVRVPPLTTGQAGDRVVVAALITLAALAALLAALVLVFRYVLNRQRVASWGDAWRSIGPQWTPDR